MELCILYLKLVYQRSGGSVDTANEPDRDGGSEELEGANSNPSHMTISDTDQHTTEIEGRPLAAKRSRVTPKMHSLPARNLQIRLTQLELDRSCRLGTGRFGSVFRGELHGTQVAVKEVVLPRRKKSIEMLDTTEIKVSALVCHPSIVQFMAYTIDLSSYEKYLFLIFELVDGQNLDHIINESDLKQLYGFDSLSKKCDILLQTSRAIAYLHNFKPTIIHGDIKPSNIMMTKNGRVKVCDLGLSKLKQNSSLTLVTTAAVSGTPLYLSPEQLLQSKTSSIQSDVYALGATMYEIIFETTLWDVDDGTNRELDDLTKLKKKVQAEEIPKDLHKKQSHPCYSLILSCVQFDHRNRPHALAIVSELEKLCHAIQFSHATC